MEDVIDVGALADEDTCEVCERIAWLQTIAVTKVANKGDTTGIVADVAEAVDGEADGEGGEHAEGGLCNNVSAGG